MGLHNSLDECKLITAILHDVFELHGNVFNTSQRKNTLKKVQLRYASEGISFLSKTLPRLAKALDRALAGGTPLNATELRFTPQDGSQLPRFLGELFNLVLAPDGTVLLHPCTKAVGSIRQVLYCYYKYELPYSAEQEHTVLSQFLQTETDLASLQGTLESIRGVLDTETSTYVRRKQITAESTQIEVAREARVLLSRVFASFDARNITPSHGPGAVATGQRLWEKFDWHNVSANITRTYPLDEFFFASLGHVCDCLYEFNRITEVDLPARVILVPKDSRGPRLISCEPVDYQWVQQGLGRAIVEWLECNNTTKYHLHFTDQHPNQCGALLGSITGGFATLDLKEASDRISTGLVRLLMPHHVFTCLSSCRSSATQLPNGEVITLLKFAPMGSSLCFPIMATCIWALLTAAAPDDYTRERILVYGDDVIVPTAYAADAMKRLESFGLKINHDKSCTGGFFRESCGVDAYRGVDVTPVRFRTVWSSSPSPDVYESWIAYANTMKRRAYHSTYDYIAGCLFHVYGRIPATDMDLPCPSLDEVPEKQRPNSTRSNSLLQRREWRVRVVRSPTIIHDINGWSMLLRFFTEGQKPPIYRDTRSASSDLFRDEQAFRVGSYTRRNTTKFRYKWVGAVSPCKQVVAYRLSTVMDLLQGRSCMALPRSTTGAVTSVDPNWAYDCYEADA